MANQKDSKVRITGYVSEQAYQLILKIQGELHLKNGKKPTYGEAMDEIAKHYKPSK